MSETRKHARALLAAIPKRAGTDVAGQSESGGILVSVHPGAVRFMDAHPDAHIGLMRLADEAPELLATLCDEVDAAERRAVEAEAAARLYAERRMNADMRADEAEANAASMREALAAVLNEHNPVRFTVCQDGECEHLALAEIAMANHAGRAILDRLERAEAERDAYKRERDTILTMVPPYAAAEARANNAEAERDAVERERDDMQREIVRLQSCVENAEAEQWDASERATNLKVERDALRAERDEMAAKVRRLESIDADLMAVAAGCSDYGGGHSGECYDAFQHGIETVVNVMKARLSGDDSYQMRVLKSVGSGAVIVEGEG